MGTIGLFSGLFGGGGSAKRAANVAAQKAEQARKMIEEGRKEYGAYYDPYRSAGSAAIGQQQSVLSDVQNRISALDPRIQGLYQQQAALQPQVDEIYGLSKQYDPILAKIQSPDMEAYKSTPGYQFRLEEGQKALERSAAAKGQLFSGQTGKALTEYGQNYSTQEYDNYLRRLYEQMGAVGQQIGGRQAALSAGQGQINAGLNLIDADYRQIAAQMGVSNAYQNLISQGLSAADAAARLGMDAVTKEAGLVKGTGETYASGMLAKDAQMKSAGDFWLNQINQSRETAAALYSGGTYQPQGNISNFGQQQPALSASGQIIPPGGYNNYSLPTNQTYSAIGNNMNYGNSALNYQYPANSNNPNAQAALRSTTVYRGAYV